MTNRAGNHAGESARASAIAGGAARGLVGLIEGLAVLAIPGVGPAVAAGTVLAWEPNSHNVLSKSCAAVMFSSLNCGDRTSSLPEKLPTSVYVFPVSSNINIV